MKRLGFNLLLFGGKIGESHRNILQKIKRIGYGCVEIPIMEFDDKENKKLSNILDDLGLERTVSTALTDASVSFISKNKVERKNALEFMKRVVDSSVLLGSELVMGPFYQPLGIFSGKGPELFELEYCEEGHRELAEYAHARGITLGLEVLNRFECYMFNTISQGVEHIRRVGNPNLKLAYDTFHANIEEGNVIDVIRKNFKHICHVHLSENNRGFIGGGHAQIKDSIDEFLRNGYSGKFVVESFGQSIPELAAATKCWRPLFKDEFDCVRKSYRYASSLIGEL